VPTSEVLGRQAHRPELAEGQRPFAVVLSCSDSRVPAELIFDCGLGELFVVRVAGNIVAPSLVGSVEFAVATFHTPLAVVMGHTRCGAIAATLEALQRPTQPLSDNVQDIIQRITPAVSELVRAAPSDPEGLMRSATRANVRFSTDHLRHGSTFLEKYAAAGRLAVVGAEYSLETGAVDFFDLGALAP
jgi:carbonic anhydrase